MSSAARGDFAKKTRPCGRFGAFPAGARLLGEYLFTNHKYPN